MVIAPTQADRVQPVAAQTVNRPRRGHSEAWGLLAVIALATVIRVWNLGGQPMLFFDSGAYMGEGAFLASATQHAVAAVLAPVSAGVTDPGPVGRVAFALQDGTDAHPPDIAKPGHAILLALSMLVFGKSALAGSIVSVLAGIGTVAATYVFGLRGWGMRVGVIAATLLAISGQHLVYSREPLVESDGLFFATVASLVYLRARSWRGLLAAGLLWGFAFTCNNRFSYVPAIFVAAEIARWPGILAFVRRGITVGVGFATPIAAIEAVYLVARGLGRSVGARTDWLDYLQQIAAFTRMNPPDRLRFDQWPTYFVDLALMDGLPVLVLFLVGLGVLIWWLVRWVARRQTLATADLLLAASLLVPLVLYSFYSTGEVRLRHFSLAMPWVMLTTALGLVWLTDRLVRGRRRVVPGVLTAGLIVLAIPRIVALDNAPSGMAAVQAFVGDRPTASTDGPVYAFYAGEERTNARLRQAFVNVPSDIPVLADRYSLLVVDMQAEVFAGELTDLYAAHAPLFAVANGNDAWYLADLLEHYGSSVTGWTDLLSKWQANRDAASQLRVYDLAPLARDIAR